MAPEVLDYDERRRPTPGMCPHCAGFKRQSVLMVQHNGGKDWVLTCADSSVCHFRKPVAGHWIDGEFLLLVRLDSPQGRQLCES